MNEIDTKESIGTELIKWMDKDATYCYTLNAYALSKGLITEEEAVIVKNDLDDYYEKNKPAQEKNKYMMTAFKKIGFTPTKILWELINQFPNKSFGDINNSELIPDNESIMKKWKIDSISFYDMISNLITAGYLSKRNVDKKLIYKINFLKLKRDYINEEK